MSKKKKQAKKTTQVQQQNMTPEKYVISGRARKLPIYECFINKGWENDGLRSLVVTRKHTTGNVTYGIYLVDAYCLGLKSTTFRFNQPYFEYAPFVNMIFETHDFGKEKIDYALAHNMIYGGVAYAEDLGFTPDKDWKITQFLLEEDTEDVELIELEFGKDGKPCFISGPYDNVGMIMNKLNKSVGEGNYDFISQILPNTSTFWDDDYEEGYDDDDDDDDYDEDDAENIDYEEVKPK